MVGDRVGEGNFPVGDAAVDDFDGRNHVVRRSIDVRSRRVGGSDVLAENDRNLGLGLWLQNPRARKEPSILDGHISEQYAEVRLVNRSEEHTSELQSLMRIS